MAMIIRAPNERRGDGDGYRCMGEFTTQILLRGRERLTLERGVQNRDVLPAAARDGFTAARPRVRRSRPLPLCPT
jgi:hypothetical protein